MKPLEFVEKYGKRTSKIVFNLLDRKILNEFIQDCQNLELSFDKSKPYCLVLKNYIDAYEILVSKSYYNEMTFLVLGGYISPVENIDFQSLNHEPLKGYKGVAILCFDNSPEAQVTREALTKAYPNVRMVTLPYGVSSRNPFADVEALIEAILQIIHEDLVAKQNKKDAAQ